MPTILLVNGPNLNLLGTREPHIYGADTLSDVVNNSKAKAESLGFDLVDFQSNHEGAIVDRIQQARIEGVHGIVVNAGEYLYVHLNQPMQGAQCQSDLRWSHTHVSRPPGRAGQYRYTLCRDSCIECTRAGVIQTPLLFIRHRGGCHRRDGCERLWCVKLLRRVLHFRADVSHKDYAIDFVATSPKFVKKVKA